MVSDGSIDGVEYAFNSPTAEETQADLRVLCKRYKDLQTQIQEEQCIHIDEIKSVPLRLWSNRYATVESRRERIQRRIFLAESKGDLSRLPLPFGNQFEVTEESLLHLSRASFRKVMRVLSICQFEAFTLQPQYFGPVVWGLSAGVSAKGGDVLLKVCNEAGVTVHPNVLNKYKSTIMKKKLESKASDRLERSDFVAFAHDNIDADLSKTTVADGIRSKTFHGTISIAQVVPGLSSIKTQEKYKPLGTNIQKASDLLADDSGHVKSAQALLIGIVASFGENLLAPDSQNATTIVYLVRRYLKGYCRGEPAKIEHLTFMNLPSGSTYTSRKVLDDYIATLLPRTDDQSPDYILAAADLPLYLRLWDLICQNVAPGERSSEYNSIVPIPGGPHFLDMCLTDVVKRLCVHAFMDGIVPFSGLTEGAASRFLTLKDPKTNHRVFEQVESACLRRIIDALLETGDLAPDDIPNFNAGTTAKGMDEVDSQIQSRFAQEFMGSGGREQAELSSLKLDENSPGEAVTNIGMKILSAIEKRAGRHDQHIFKHFALDLVFKTLVPCVMCHYLSRAGQIGARTSLLKQLVPALFVTGKHKYHNVMLFCLRELECAPAEVKLALMSPAMATTNLLCINPFGNVEKDEALEETGVKSTKENTSQRTEHYLRKSIYTAGDLRKAFYWVSNTLKHSSRRKNFIATNFEKRLSRGSYKMYQKLCGTDDRPPWVGLEHCSMETLSNITTSPYLTISRSHQDRLLKMKETGMENMDRSGNRFIPELRSRATQEQAAEAHALKINKMEHFNDAFKKRVKQRDKKRITAIVKGKKNTLVTNVFKDRSLELCLLLKVIVSSETPPDLRAACEKRANFLYQHPDLMTVTPDAFMDNTGLYPRPPHKAHFWRKVQDVLGPRMGFFVWVPNIDNASGSTTTTNRIRCRSYECSASPRRL